MKVSDAIADWLISHGVNVVFGISGGASLHLLHSCAAKGIKLVCPQHECSSAFAADAYARIRGFGVAIVTSGPGATNAVTGLAASYYDSIPVLLLSGNQTRERLQQGSGVRQYGFQATPIVEVASAITKGAWQIWRPEEIIATLDKALRVAKEGRPGPVLVDVPDDVQRAQVCPVTIKVASCQTIAA